MKYASRKCYFLFNVPIVHTRTKLNTSCLVPCAACTTVEIVCGRTQATDASKEKKNNEPKDDEVIIQSALKEIKLLCRINKVNQEQIIIEL